MAYERPRWWTSDGNRSTLRACPCTSAELRLAPRQRIRLTGRELRELRRHLRKSPGRPLCLFVSVAVGSRLPASPRMIERAGKNQRRIGQAVGGRQNAANRSRKYIRERGAELLITKGPFAGRRNGAIVSPSPAACGPGNRSTTRSTHLGPHFLLGFVCPRRELAAPAPAATTLRLRSMPRARRNGCVPPSNQSRSNAAG